MESTPKQIKIPDLPDDLKGDIGIFIDRDGTINKAEKGEYITRWTLFEFLPGALEGMAEMAELPVKIFIVTNQSAVHRDLITAGELEHIHSMMEFEIVSNGGKIDGLKYCPHIPKENCSCRKPGTLLFEEFAREHAIDLEKSINIGDHIRDMKAGASLNMTNILVRTGYGQMAEMELMSTDIRVHRVVDNLLDASKVISDLLQD
jgi:D-glycero-D-manno-heptose 1,7-bisphosphate phosphatase